MKKFEKTEVTIGEGIILEQSATNIKATMCHTIGNIEYDVCLVHEYNPSEDMFSAKASVICTFQDGNPTSKGTFLVEESLDYPLKRFVVEIIANSEGFDPDEYEDDYKNIIVDVNNLTL